MPPLVVVCVGVEKEIEDFVTAVENTKSKVGPLKVFHAYKSIDAVTKINNAYNSCKRLDAVLMSHHFTAKGKEEYSDAIRKVLKEKYGSVPIVCWGHVAKGGNQGKDYHYPMEWDAKTPNHALLAATLMSIKNGEITAEWKEKGGRKSIDKAVAPVAAVAGLIGRKSIDSPAPASPAAPARRTSIEGAAPAARRNSIEGPAPARRTSIEGTAPAARRKSIEASPKDSPRASLDVRPAQSSPRASLDLRGMQPMMPMMGGNSFTSMQPMLAGNSFTGMSPMMGTNSFTGMAPMMPMSGMSPMSPMAVQPMPMKPMQPMGMQPMMPMNGMAMPGMLSPMPAAPAPAPITPDASNGELIKALADEVNRLKLMVEEKRMREGVPLGNGVNIGMV